MKNRGQLFDLHADLDVKTRKLKAKKPAQTKTSPIKDVVSKASSADFYEDERPIQLSGPSMYNYGMSDSWTGSFEANPVEEADYAVMNSYINDTNETDDRGIQMSESDNVQYAEETPTTYRAMSEDDYSSASSEPSFLDEISNLAAPHVPPRPSHPDPLKALGEAVKGMSDDDFAKDLAAILEGNKVYDPDTKELVGKDKVDDDFAKKLKEADAQRAGSTNDKTSTNTTDKNKPDPNAIFEKIAQNMSFANSFDLGEFEMEQRFDSFDAEAPAPPAPPSLPGFADLPKPPDPLKELKSALPFSTEDFVKDLTQIGANAEALEKIARDGNWPPPPTDLTQPNAERTKQMFGTFEYEADSTAGHCGIKIKGTWEPDNITNVDIPQLTGKKIGNTEIKKGMIRFNKKAAKQLQKLWAAWETAGLLDRVLTYDGGFVPRFIKRKDGTCATTLSNHAWGSAFDINATWNGLGAEPALVGSKGCVRELVEIANQHGFYWGGHFGTKDGMHFEVAKIIEYKD